MAVEFEIIDNNELQFGVGASDELEFGTRDIIEIRQSGDYEDLTNKPSINGVTLIGNKTTEELLIDVGVTSVNGQTGDVSGLAEDSDVVHIAGTETITGKKSFTKPVTITTNENEGFNLKSPSAGGYLYVTRGEGANAVQMAIKAGNSGGTFGTTTNHQFQFRTKDIARMTIGADGSVVLASDVAASSNNNQVATTKWVNDKGYVNASQAASAAPVQSVNGQTGDVSISVPTKTSDLTNDSGFVASSQVPTKTSDLTNDSGFITSADIPVTSVNGETGAVVLDASDVGALPSSTPIHNVPSGGTSGQVLTKSSNSDYAVEWSTPTGAVSSVNGQTGAVVLDADDVGALPDDTQYVGSVNVTQSLSSGTKIGSIEVDGSSTNLYAPTNTDTKVTQTATTTTDYTYWRGLCIGNSAVSAESTGFSTVTDQVRTFNNLRVQPSTGTIKANIFKGDLTGTASGNLKSGDNVSSLTNDAGYLTPSSGVTSVNGNTGAVTVTEGLAPLIGSIATVTPMQVSAAIAEGRDVLITHVDNTFGVLEFSAFNEAATVGCVVSNTLVYYYGTMIAYQLIGWKNTDEWETRDDILALSTDIPTIPTNVSSFTNDVGYLTASTGVTSVNGNRGAVTVSVPTKTSDLTNDSGFVTAAQAASAAPVQSVNGQTGAVTVDTMPSATGEPNGTALVVVDGAWSKQTGYGYQSVETGELFNLSVSTTALNPTIIQDAFQPVVGETYEVEYDSVDYELTAIADTIPSFGDAVYFGNGQLAGLTGGDPNCPFFYGYITSMGAGGVVTLTDGTHTIVVNGSKLVGHKFNPDYVPVQNVNGETQVWNERTFVGTIGSIKAQGGVSFGFNSTAFGQALAGGDCSFAEGSGSASADYSHAEGGLTSAAMFYAHAEGVETIANGQASHAEGTFSVANGASSHAEGQQTNAWGAGSHAEGWQTQAVGAYSHAEGGIYSPDGGSGTQTYASGDYSHAEGRGTEASGEASHSEGVGTIAHGTYQHASGKFNIQDNNNTYAEIIGNGTATNARSNARTLDWSGNEWVAGSMTAAGGFVGNVTGTASGNLPSSTTYAASNAVGGSATFANGIHYGRVDNTSTSTVFTATIPGITEYYDGLTIILYNGKVTSASGYTININGLGAYGTYSNMAVGNENTPTAPTRDTTIFNINYAMIFIYCSDIGGQGVTGWICYRGYDANTNTIGYQLRTNSSTMPAADKFYRYRILFTSADGHKWVPSTTSTSTNATAARAVNQRPIDPFGEIVYYGTTTAIEANANVTAAQLWQQYTMTLGYAFNRTGAALVLPYPSPIYIKCAPQSDGSAIIDADNPYVFTLPSTEDGKIYIYLGRTYSATAIEMTMNHPVYYYKGGAVRLWTNEQSDMPSVTSADEGKVLMVVNGAWAAASLPIYNGGVS